MRIIFQDRNAGAAQTIEMPFSKMGRGVPGLAKRFSDGLFLESNGEAVIVNPGPVVGPSC